MQPDYFLHTFFASAIPAFEAEAHRNEGNGRPFTVLTLGPLSIHTTDTQLQQIQRAISRYFEQQAAGQTTVESQVPSAVPAA